LILLVNFVIKDQVIDQLQERGWILVRD